MEIWLNSWVCFQYVSNFQYVFHGITGFWWCHQGPVILATRRVVWPSTWPKCLRVCGAKRSHSILGAKKKCMVFGMFWSEKGEVYNIHDVFHVSKRQPGGFSCRFTMNLVGTCWIFVWALRLAMIGKVVRVGAFWSDFLGLFHRKTWVVDWLIDWWMDWLIDWLIDWSIDRSIDRLIDWLIDWLIFALVSFLHFCMSWFRMLPLPARVATRIILFY